MCGQSLKVPARYKHRIFEHQYMKIKALDAALPPTISASDIDQFRLMIWDYFKKNGRDFSWRQSPYDSYSIVVSEVMLQQTQTHRVTGKFEQFIAKFPSFAVLAQSSVVDLITAWQGLGYNRRALALQKIAQIVMQNHEGVLPNSPELLQTFPGIGPATAASICAFAFNTPTVFIETNVRAVYLHHFFRDKAAVSDKELIPLVQAALDRENPRQWYYALMDYGVMLKKLHKNPSRKSAHYTKQSTFENSERQIRGAILRIMAEHRAIRPDDLIALIGRDERRIIKNIAALEEEGFIKHNNDLLTFV